MESKRKFSGISGSTLKIIAIVSMFVDHIGAAVLEKGLLVSSQVQNNPVLYLSLIHI